MIRFIVHLAKVAIAAITALLFASCGSGTGNIATFKTVTGNGNVISQTRTVNDNFTGIETGGNFEVIVEHGSPVTVTVEADSNYQEYITTDVTGSVLNIGSNVNTHGGTKRVIVKMPVLEKVITGGASSVTGKGVFKSGNFNLNASGASKINLYADAGNAIFNSSGASGITVTGKAESLSCDASGSSEINAKSMIAKKVTADASGSSVIYTDPLESLTADGSGSSRITFKSKPQSIITDKSGSASISQEK